MKIDDYDEFFVLLGVLVLNMDWNWDGKSQRVHITFIKAKT
jgi:hypothetical protein